MKFWEEKNIKISSIITIFTSSLDLVIFSTAHSEYQNSDKLIKLLLSNKNLLILIPLVC